jgi:hypothetical protein
MMISSQVSSARILVNISGTVRVIDLKFSHVKDMGFNLRVYSSATTTMVAEHSGLSGGLLKVGG